MKKLFISQPMRGKSDEDILAERKKAIELAQEMIGEPVEVIDSFFQEAPVDAKPLWSLENPWNFCQEQMWRILRRVGKMQEVV